MRVVQLKGGFELVARTEELHGLIDRSNTHDRAKKKKMSSSMPQYVRNDSLLKLPSRVSVPRPLRVSHAAGGVLACACVTRPARERGHY